MVTHNVSVMIVQAGAARKIMASSPADAEDALLAVESTGREAMTELRNLLGLLSPAPDWREEAGAAVPADVLLPAGVSCAGAMTTVRAAAGAGQAAGPAPASLRPQPGLGELDALIGRVSSAGLPVELEVSGVPRPLSPGADLAAYRVVQEGLTNVLRHAGGAPASVRVCWDDSLEITVSDSGKCSPSAGLAAGGGLASDGSLNGAGGGTAAAGRGRGLLGLHERLALYGGELAAGLRPEGGWRLRAVLPLTDAAASARPGDRTDDAADGHPATWGKP